LPVEVLIIRLNIPHGNICPGNIFYDGAVEEKNIVGSRVVEARRSAKPRISQKDLVARLQLQGMTITQSSLSKIEHRRLPVTDMEVVALARALKVPIAWLLQIDS